MWIEALCGVWFGYGVKERLCYFSGWKAALVLSAQRRNGASERALLLLESDLWKWARGDGPKAQVAITTASAKERTAFEPWHPWRGRKMAIHESAALRYKPRAPVRKSLETQTANCWKAAFFASPQFGVCVRFNFFPPAERASECSLEVRKNC